MPRKLRNPKTRRAVEISACIFSWLLWRDASAARAQAERDGDLDVFDAHYFFDWSKEAQLWASIEAEALEEWTPALPGTRPRLWWQYSAPELRELTGGGAYHETAGAGRCHETGIPYIANWESDPPLVESTPMYLDRLDLWLPGERARVPVSAFAAEQFSYTLTVAPRRVEDSK